MLKEDQILDTRVLVLYTDGSFSIQKKKPFESHAEFEKYIKKKIKNSDQLDKIFYSSDYIEYLCGRLFSAISIICEALKLQGVPEQHCDKLAKETVEALTDHIFKEN